MAQLKVIRKTSGFTLLEILVVLAIVSITIAVAMPDWKRLQNNTQDSATQVVGHFKKIRAKALSTTRAYRISATSGTAIVAQYANTCAATTWTTDSTLSLTLSGGSYMPVTSWTVCYDSLGLSPASTSFTLQQSGYATRTIQIVLGGAVRWV